MYIHIYVHTRCTEVLITVVGSDAVLPCKNLHSQHAVYAAVVPAQQ